MSNSATAAKQQFPVNRLVAFLGPYVAIASGAAATWLSRHFPGLHLETKGTASTISSTVIFLVGAGITWALHHKWLDGWQKWEATLVAIDPGLGPILSEQGEGTKQQAPPAAGEQATSGQTAPAAGAQRADVTPVPVALTPPAPSALAAAQPSAPGQAAGTPAPATAETALLVASAPNGQTQAGSGESLHPYPGFALRLGMTCPEVRAWQQGMAKLDWTVTVDGVYGPQSEALCRSFQAQHQLPVNGEVSPATWYATFAGSP